MAYVKRHATNNLKRSIDYIKNENKTDELLVYENHLASSDTDEIVRMMNLTKENFDKTDGIQGHHFIQSFKHDEDIDFELAHQVGKEWSEKFISDYEFVLATHKDKNHIHNHIIINSVNCIDGKKYLSNIKEREEIRKLSDEVCKLHNLSIIKPLDKEQSIKGTRVSYGEWKYQRENISWKDKIRIDIDRSIAQSENYQEFIQAMKEKNYELRYGKNYKYNSFKHFDIGKKIRGRTLGSKYTEEKIKERILNREQEQEEQTIFYEENYFINGISNKEIVQADINLSILEATSYKDFIDVMQEKNYKLRYGENYKFNSFKHKDMKRAVRGKTIGYDYTENKIKDRIIINNELQERAEKKEEINLEMKTTFSKRYVSNKYKYLNVPNIKSVSKAKQEEIQNRRKSLKYNQIIHFLKQNGIQRVDQYHVFKKDVEQNINSLIQYLNGLAKSHHELMSSYKQTPTQELKEQMISNAKEHEKHKLKYEELNKVRAEFPQVDSYLINKEKEKDKNQEQTQEREKQKQKEREKGYGDIIR